MQRPSALRKTPSKRGVLGHEEPGTFQNYRLASESSTAVAEEPLKRPRVEAQAAQRAKEEAERQQKEADQAAERKRQEKEEADRQFAREEARHSEFHDNSRVRLQGLTTAQYNGKAGVLDGYCADVERWLVRLDDGTTIKVKERNLVEEASENANLPVVITGAVAKQSEAPSTTFRAKAPLSSEQACGRAHTHVLVAVQPSTHPSHTTNPELTPKSAASPAKVTASRAGQAFQNASPTPPVTTTLVEPSQTTSPEFRAKAATRLAQALGEGCSDLAESIVDTFISVNGALEAPPRLRSLISALRSNRVLRESVVKRGAQSAVALAAEDPRDWANDGVKAKRQGWAKAAMAEASANGVGFKACPECGGKAMFETGKSPAFKMAKAYVRYRCTELACGKETHITE